MADTVTFDRQELFEFFGQTILPGPGRQGFIERSLDEMADGDVDCAMLAMKIEAWVDEHDRSHYMPET